MADKIAKQSTRPSIYRLRRLRDLRAKQRASAASAFKQKAKRHPKFNPDRYRDKIQNHILPLVRICSSIIAIPSFNECGLYPSSLSALLMINPVFKGRLAG